MECRNAGKEAVAPVCPSDLRGAADGQIHLATGHVADPDVTFMEEHPKLAKQAYIVCRCPRPMQLHQKVTALPWFCL